MLATSHVCHAHCFMRTMLHPPSMPSMPCRLLGDLATVDHHLTFWQAQLAAPGHASFMLLGRGPAAFVADLRRMTSAAVAAAAGWGQAVAGAGGAGSGAGAAFSSSMRWLRSAGGGAGGHGSSQDDVSGDAGGDYNDDLGDATSKIQQRVGTWLWGWGHKSVVMGLEEFDVGMYGRMLIHGFDG